MTINDWLTSSTKLLEQAQVPSARLDCLILLEDALGKDRAWLLAHSETNVNDTANSRLAELLKRRANHVPLAYIRGKSEFYGREFIVTPATLQPRSETETMIELLLDRVKDGAQEIKSIVDIGTGSGCLAVTAKLELPESDVYATELNQDALEVAKQNSRDLRADVKFYSGNLLDPLPEVKTVYAIVANLPYVPDEHAINNAAMQEPKVAIFGGSDGLDLYHEMFGQTKQLDNRPSVILTESLPFQHAKLEQVAIRSGYKLVGTQDLIQVFEAV